MASKVEELLASAFTRVARQACRQGEAQTREWPPLEELYEAESWKFVGEKYAHEFLAELFGNNLREVLKEELM